MNGRANHWHTRWSQHRDPEVGAENFLLNAEEVSALPKDTTRATTTTRTELRQVIDSIASGYFSSANPDLFKPIRCCTETSTYTSQITSLTLTARSTPQHTVTRRTGLECRFSTWLAWANSLRPHYSEYCQES